MRRCPICGQSFEDDAYYCPIDGCALASVQTRGPLAGLRLDERYFVEERIGSGGLGEVYRVRHIKMGKPFALKVLAGAAHKDEQQAVRFDREARVLSMLRHPYCIEVTDYGHSDHGPFIVMELVDGEPLSRFTKGVGLPLGQALDVMIRVLVGLEHAHDQGIIHRDIKPDNIMLVQSNTQPGQLDPKILDFGLAKLQPGYLETGDLAALTAPGKVLGTPAYLAPERVVAAQGGSIDHSVDLYAVGVILYELSTGKRPFFSDDLAAIVRQHLLLEPKPPSAFRPELPAALDAVILRALAKKPSERYPSAAALREALEALLPLDPALAAAAPPLQRKAAGEPEDPSRSATVSSRPPTTPVGATPGADKTQLSAPPFGPGRLPPWVLIAGGATLVVLVLLGLLLWLLAGC